MSNVLFDASIGGYEQVLDLRVQQNALTATNIANKDTPHFRARFLDFSRVLGETMGASDRPTMQVTDRLHLRSTGTPDNPPVATVEPTPWSTDDNSVFEERERARLVANKVVYTGLVRGVSRRLAMLKYAASDGR